MKSKGLKEVDVTKHVKNFLIKEGWSRRMVAKDLSEKGADIVVTHKDYGRRFIIEVKGATENYKSGFETAFVYGLGQILTRMKAVNSRCYYGLALPERSTQIALRRIPYQLALRLCIQILSVDDLGNVTWYKPRDIKNLQLKKD